MTTIDHALLARLEPWQGEIPSPERLKSLREGVRLSQEQLSVMGGVTCTAYKRYERGKTENPRALNTDAFRRAISYLFDAAARRRAARAEEKKVEAFV